ncbi:MAG: hypothetical protein SPG61_01270 [Arcanobacterium sp.]|nr:hypothetical protein [Arcanobacterium sp.]
MKSLFKKVAVSNSRSESGSITVLNAVGILFICSVTLMIVGYLHHENMRNHLQNTVDLYAISVAQLVQNGVLNTESCGRVKMFFHDVLPETSKVKCEIPAEIAKVQIISPSPLPLVKAFTLQAEAGPRN